MNKARFAHLLQGEKPKAIASALAATPKRKPIEPPAAPSQPAKDLGRLCTHPQWAPCQCDLNVTQHSLKKETSV